MNKICLVLSYGICASFILLVPVLYHPLQTNVVLKIKTLAFLLFLSVLSVVILFLNLSLVFITIVSCVMICSTNVCVGELQNLLTRGRDCHETKNCHLR